MIKGFRRLNLSGRSTHLLRLHKRAFSQQPEGLGSYTNEEPSEQAFDYQFVDKTFAFVVDTPLFVSRPKSLFVGRHKVNLIKAMMPDTGQLFASAVMPLKLEKDVPDTPDISSQSAKIIKVRVDEPDPAKKTLDSRYVYGLASYCAVDLVDDTHISLNCVHKVKVQTIDELTLHPENREGDLARLKERLYNGEAPLSGPSGAFARKKMPYQQSNLKTERTLKPPWPEAKEAEPINGKRSSSSKKSVFEVINNAFDEQSRVHSITGGHKVGDSQFCYVSENQGVPVLNYSMLSRPAQIQMDYLNRQIKTTLPQAHEQLPNYATALDLRLFIDRLTYTVSGSRFLERDIRRVHLSESIEEIIDSSLTLVKRYRQFYNSLKLVGRQADARLKQKRQEEYKRDIYHITKRLAEREKEDPLDALARKMADKAVPGHIKEVFGEMLERLRSMERGHPEYPHSKHYLEIVASLPYGLRSQDNYDLDRARRVLEESHFGLKDVKKRVLEFLAVGKLTETLRGKILCFVGAPGVGKTSFAFTVAKALDRAVFRISLGGENDVSVLKGHRRTYIGSRPGKLVKGLRECQTENCVIIIDEIDKIGTSSPHGDPQATLLEVLDPEQNNAFVDNYLDFPIDLSSVFFICTANTLTNIHSALRDRMDVINIGSYTNGEKRAIFNQFLLPRATEEAGLLSYNHLFALQPMIVDKIIGDYSREAGIRSLKKHTEKLMEKIAHMIVEAQEKAALTSEAVVHQTIEVREDNLASFIGPVVFDESQAYPAAVTGVVKGLAFNNLGGTVLHIEASATPARRSKSGLKFTGSLGAVMKESVTIAYSFARRFLSKRDIRFLERYMIHVHVSDGATPKDGPSAGLAITTALISLGLNRPLTENVPMTGEMSLKGRVLRVGGLNEKVAAARRDGSVQIILPEANKEEVEFMDPEAIEGIRFIFVTHYDDVFEAVFGGNN